MTTLKLDYDTPQMPRDFVSRVRQLAELLEARVPVVMLRRTRRGWHAVIQLSGVTLDPGAIVAAQALLGSDPVRELLNLSRVVALPRLPKMWRSRWNVLFAAKL